MQIPSDLLAQKILETEPSLNISEAGLTEIIQNLYDGYEPMPTMIGYSHHFNKCDWEVVNENPTCEFCGVDAMVYAGYKNSEGYLAFAECQNCGHSISF